MGEIGIRMKKNTQFDINEGDLLLYEYDLGVYVTGCLGPRGFNFSIKIIIRFYFQCESAPASLCSFDSDAVRVLGG